MGQESRARMRTYHVRQVQLAPTRSRIFPAPHARPGLFIPSRRFDASNENAASSGALSHWVTSGQAWPARPPQRFPLSNGGAVLG